MEIYNVNMAILHQALTLGKHSVPAAAFSAPRGEKREERRARGERERVRDMEAAFCTH